MYVFAIASLTNECGFIRGYRLYDAERGDIKDISAGNIKQYIREGRLKVENLRFNGAGDLEGIFTKIKDIPVITYDRKLIDNNKVGMAIYKLGEEGYRVVDALGKCADYSVDEVKAMYSSRSILNIRGCFGNISGDHLREIDMTQDSRDSIKERELKLNRVRAKTNLICGSYRLMADLSVTVTSKSEDLSIMVPAKRITPSQLKYVKNLKLPSTFTELPSNIFNSTKLNSIELSEGLELIYDRAFDTQYLLNEIKIPSTVKSIGDYAFRLCSELRVMEIPESVESIGIGLFSDCYRLRELTIKAKIKSLPYEMLKGCHQLRKLELPDTLEELYSGDLMYKKLRTFNVPKALKKVSGINTLKMFLEEEHINEIIKVVKANGGKIS